MLLAQTIGQIFGIEFSHILPFCPFFNIKSDQNYLQFIFHGMIIYIRPMIEDQKVLNEWGPKSGSPIVNVSRVQP